jgi:hypothetical protein
MAVGEIIGGGVGLLKGLFGGESDEEKAARLQLENAQQQFEDQPAYNAPALDYNPNAYAAPETPEGQTISEDPNIKAAQMSALNSMLTRSNEGLTAEERRQQDLSRRKQEQTTQGAEEAIIANMAARGLGGSGMEYALRQQAAQNAADTASQGGLAREATNADQKLAALNNLLTGAGQVRGQDFTVNKTNADIVNDFATENSRRRNAISAANTELANNAQMSNKQAGREDYKTAYEQDVAKRKALAGQGETMADFYGQQDVANTANNNNMWNNVGTIAGGIYNTATGDKQSINDPNKPKKIKYDPYTGEAL